MGNWGRAWINFSLRSSLCWYCTSLCSVHGLTVRYAHPYIGTVRHFVPTVPTKKNQPGGAGSKKEFKGLGAIRKRGVKLIRVTDTKILLNSGRDMF